MRVTLLLILLAGAGGLAYAAGPPWPTFGQNPQHTHRSSHPGPTQPNLLWQHAIPNGRNINFAPTINADGTIYIGTWGNAPNNFSGQLYAIRPDGSLKWQFDPGPPEQPSQNQHPIWGTIEASVAIAPNGTLYFGRGDNKLYALTPQGTLKWVFPTFPPGFPEQGGQVISSPTIGSNGAIYFGTVPYTQAGRSALFAVNPDGSKKWHLDMDISGVWASPALAADGTIYAGDRAGNLYAVEDRGQDNYHIKWHYRPPAADSGPYYFGPPSIGADGTIYAPAAQITGFCQAIGKLHALTDDGDHVQEKWTFTFPFSAETTITDVALSIATDGTLYVGAASLNNSIIGCNRPDRGALYALADNGAGQPPTQKWSYPASGGVTGLAVGSNGNIFAAIRGDLNEDTPGQVIALTPDDGQPLWPAPIQTQGEIWWGTPAIGANGVLYFADAPCADILNLLPCNKAPALYAVGQPGHAAEPHLFLPVILKEG